MTGFDIYSTVRNGMTVEVLGFAALTVATDGVNRFYPIALPTGKAQSRGIFRAGNAVTDIAIPLNQL